MMICSRVWISFVTCCLVVAQRTNALRIPKEEARPKPKCHANLTSFTKDTSNTPWIPKCIALNHPYCLDVRLPYNSTIVPDYLPDIKTFDEISSYLERWRGIKKLPKCWPILQMALCSILMPQCDEDPLTAKASGYYRPNVEICHDLVNKDDCKFLARQFEDWPSIFNCDDTNIYAKNCTNELRSIKFSAAVGQPQCQYPLVPDSEEMTWFNEISGCAMHCKFPVFNLSEQANVRLFIKILSGCGMVATIAAIVLFTANNPTRERKSYRMAKVIKRCTWCQFLVYVGWSLQMLLDVDIGCGHSGSTLYGLSLVANSCVLSFLLTYLPSLCNLFWCAHLGKLCHEKLLGKETKSDGNTAVDKIASLFNYGFPSVLFACVLFLGYIDGRALHGVCTVGQQSLVVKTVFVFAPTLIGTVYGNYFFLSIIIKLWSQRGATMRPSLWRTLVRFAALASLTVLQISSEMANYFYENMNYSRWQESVNRFVGCQLNLQSIDLTMSSQETWNSGSSQSKCTLEGKSLVILDYTEILTKLSLGLVIASWSFYEANYIGLRRKLVDMLLDEEGRQKIARGIINPEHGHINGQARFPQEDLELATYRDLIDMTWCDDNQNNRRDPDRVPSSLGSIALPLDLDSEDSSMLNQNLGHDMRSKPHDSYKDKRRDIMREVKLAKQQQQQQTNAHVNNAPQIAHDTSTLMTLLLMNKLMETFNPPDLSALQPPSFNQGYCGNEPTQDNPSDSGVQQEESKT